VGSTVGVAVTAERLREHTREPARRGVWLANAAAAAVGLAAVTALGRGAGFVRTLVFARTVGATCLGDTYVTANTVPNILFDVVAGGALAALVVPVMAGPAARGDREIAGRTASALLSWAVLVTLPVMVIGAIVAKPLVGLLIGSGGAGCDRAAEVTAGTRMLLVFLPQVLLYAIGVVAAGVLQAHRRVVASAWGPLLSSIVVIATYVAFGARQEPADLARVSVASQLVLAVGTTLGVAALALPLLWPAARLRLPIRPTLRFPAAIGRRVRGLAIAGLTALVAQQISVAVVLRLAREGAGGSLVLYNLAWTVFLVPWAVLAVPLATSAFPRLAARVDAGDDAGYRAHAAPVLKVVVAVTVAAAAALAAAALPLARMLALRVPGNADTSALAWTICAFAPGLVGYGIVAFVTRALYARGVTRGPATAVCAGWACVVAADLALVPAFAARWRVVALGVGNSIGMTVAAVALMVLLGKTAGSHPFRTSARTFAFSITAGVVGVALGGMVAIFGRRAGAAASFGMAAASGIVAAAICGGLVWLTWRPADREWLRQWWPRWPRGAAAAHG